MAEFSTLGVSTGVADDDQLLVANAAGDTPLRLPPRRLSDKMQHMTGSFLGSFDKWNTAKARSSGNPARCVILGDSNVDGHGANGGVDSFRHGFAYEFATSMGWLKGSIYGSQMVGTVLSDYLAYNANLTASGANTKVDPSTNSGIIGGRFFQNATGAVGSFTWAPPEEFDTLLFVYPTVTANAGAVTVTIDGSLVDTVNQNIASSMVVKKYTGLGLSTHTVVIGFPSSGSGYFSALELQDRTNRTPIYLQGGWSGAKSGDFNVSTNPWSLLNEIVNTDLAFDYGIHYCTINDLNGNTAQDAFYDNVEAVIAKLAATADGCLMFGFPADNIQERNGSGITYDWNLRNIAKDYGWSYFDSRDVFGHSYKRATALSLNYDGNHPNATGHTALATALYDFLGPSL